MAKSVAQAEAELRTAALDYLLTKAAHALRDAVRAELRAEAL